MVAPRASKRCVCRRGCRFQGNDDTIIDSEALTAEKHRWPVAGPSPPCADQLMMDAKQTGWSPLNSPPRGCTCRGHEQTTVIDFIADVEKAVEWEP